MPTWDKPPQGALIPLSEKEIRIWKGERWAEWVPPSPGVAQGHIRPMLEDRLVQQGKAPPDPQRSWEGEQREGGRGRTPSAATRRRGLYAGRAPSGSGTARGQSGRVSLGAAGGWDFFRQFEHDVCLVLLL